MLIGPFNKVQRRDKPVVRRAIQRCINGSMLFPLKSSLVTLPANPASLRPGTSFKSTEGFLLLVVFPDAGELLSTPVNSDVDSRCAMPMTILASRGNNNRASATAEKKLAQQLNKIRATLHYSKFRIRRDGLATTTSECRM